MRKLRFYWLCLSVSFRHSIGWGDGVGFLLGIAIPILRHYFPNWETAMNELVWQIPLGIFASVFFIRLILAPYWIYKGKCAQMTKISDEKKQLEQKLKDVQSDKSLILTPRAWAIGLSGMTGYPYKPDGEYWLRLEASINGIDKPIDTLDLIVEDKIIPANQWNRVIVTAFTVYFKITDLTGKFQIQAELQARIQGNVHSSGRFLIDFNIEPGGFSRYF